MAVRDIVQAAAGVGGGGEYVEDVFSTYLYTGNDSTQTITNGIDLDSEGGMVWVKSRDQAGNPTIIDTARGVNKNLPTNQTYAQDSDPSISSFNSNGFSINSLYGFINDTGINYASWTFRKAPKFFDVVTWTGENYGGGRQISHNLGSVPGTIIIKKTNGASAWYTWHRSTPSSYYTLDSTNEGLTSNTKYYFGDGSVFVAPTSEYFTTQTMNENGFTYVAYLFAHDAGGFGDDGEQNVISCGSFTTDGVGSASVTVGYEPQWLMVKKTNAAEKWVVVDNMRGFSQSTTLALSPNTTAVDDSYGSVLYPFTPTATGFTARETFSTSSTYIYIAIRRGPMKTPESGTEVYNAIARAGTGAVAAITGMGFPPDLVLSKDRTAWFGLPAASYDRLRGSTRYLLTGLTNAEVVGADSLTAFNMDGVTVGADTNIGQINNTAGSSYITWMFRRAPGFMDVVCWTGNNNTNQRVLHNLGVVPELIIYKGRNKVNYWRVYFGDINKYIQLDANIAAVSGSNLWGSSAPTTTDFGINCGSMDLDNFNAVGYLFASLPGVSKVGTYIGTAANLNVDCGFSAGARFVLIKRTDPGSTGDWYVWDSARGIVSGNDPYLLLNSPVVENTSTDYIDPLASGFTVTSSAPAALNASGGTYIFLAIA